MAPNQFSSILDRQHQFFATGKTRSIEFRYQQLQTLRKVILENESKILEALYQDLHKHPQEAFMTEILVVLEEIKLAETNLARWMRPRKTPTPLQLYPACSQILHEPLGSVLIIGPWNYPLHLVLLPLVGSIAAGNCSVIKASEMAISTSKLLNAIIPQVFPPEYIKIIDGCVEETTELLKLPFNHIFFTGSTAVGKIVMEAAAKNLTPVTLELGGKSPCIVDEKADLEVAARRIVWGKFLNAGQTCVAPDYLYVHEKVADALIEKMRSYVTEFFGESPQTSDSFGRIINSRHHSRLVHLLNSAGNVILGGDANPEERYLSPTLIDQVTWSDPIMGEEIFGPLLPILRFKTLEEVFAELHKRDRPLAAYFFSECQDSQQRFLTEVAFGGGCINDTVVQLANPHLPFGGLGTSGMGAYHGENSFLALSHAKSVVVKSKYFDLPIRYPKYSKTKLKWMKRIFRV